VTIPVATSSFRIRVIRCGIIVSVSASAIIPVIVSTIITGPVRSISVIRITIATITIAAITIATITIATVSIAHAEAKA
jgi:hypothetical protein